MKYLGMFLRAIAAAIGLFVICLANLMGDPAKIFDDIEDRAYNFVVQG